MSNTAVRGSFDTLNPNPCSLSSVRRRSLWQGIPGPCHAPARPQLPQWCPTASRQPPAHAFSKASEARTTAPRAARGRCQPQPPPLPRAPCALAPANTGGTSHRSQAHDQAQDQPGSRHDADTMRVGPEFVGGSRTMRILRSMRLSPCEVPSPSSPASSGFSGLLSCSFPGDGGFCMLNSYVLRSAGPALRSFSLHF